MALNIKNADTYRLIRELAELTGESMTAAVTGAVRERLDRVRAARQGEDVETRALRVLELAATIRDGTPAGYFRQDFDELLYDERGLPK
jgi:antitoxin VapB